MSTTSRLKKLLGRTVGFATERNVAIGTAVSTVAVLVAPGVVQAMGGDLGVTSDQVALTATAVGFGGWLGAKKLARAFEDTFARMKDLGDNRPEAVLSKAGEKPNPKQYLMNKLEDMSLKDRMVMNQFMEGTKTLDAVSASKRHYTDASIARGMKAYRDLEKGGPSLGRDAGGLSMA